MENNDGIPINLISRESLESLRSEERVNFVLNEVKEGKVLILEMGLSAVEEANLIAHTMKVIDHETFIGIEIQSYSKAFPRDNGGTWLDRLLKRKKTPRMAVIGPASLLKTIHKDGNVIQTMLVTREHVFENSPKTSIGDIESETIYDNIEVGLGEYIAVTKEVIEGEEIEEEGKDLVVDSEEIEEEEKYLDEMNREEGDEEEDEDLDDIKRKEVDEEEDEDLDDIKREEGDEEEDEDLDDIKREEVDEEGEDESSKDGGFIDIHDILEDYGVAEGGN